MKAFLIITLLASMAMSQNPVMTFDCNTIPEICNNMCWGVHCTSGAFSKTLTSDYGAADPVKKSRRTSAGCLPSPNQCSNTATNSPNKGKGLNCDEFPFASTRDADQGGQNIRCVPIQQNRMQGGVINSFYAKFAPAGTKYDIAFTNPSAPGVKYCTNPAGGNACVNDGNIFQKKVLSPNPSMFTPKRSEIVNPMYLYRTRLGKEMSSATLFEVGRKLYSFVPRNDTLGVMDFAGGPAAMGGVDDLNLELVVDHVAERIM